MLGKLTDCDAIQIRMVVSDHLKEQISTQSGASLVQTVDRSKLTKLEKKKLTQTTFNAIIDQKPWADEDNEKHEDVFQLKNYVKYNLHAEALISEMWYSTCICNENFHLC